MSGSRMDSLPPELILRLLTLLNTPQDLLALIRSTRYLYETFRLNKLTVLSAVIRNGMPDDNLFVAVATCRAAQVSKAWAAASSLASCVASQSDFYAANPGGVSPRSTSLHNESLLISLYKLWNITDYFISRFTADSFHNIVSKLPSIQRLQQLRDLSAEEESCLQRAFFRFEMHRRLTPTRVKNRQGVDRESDYGHSLTFLKLFPPWEREQILAIEEFLIEHGKDIVRNSIDFMVETISNVVRVKSAIPGATFDDDPIRMLEMTLDLNCVDIFFQDYGPRKEIFLTLAGKGLAFLRWLEGVEPRAKLHLLCAFALNECRPTIFDLLSLDEDVLKMSDTQSAWVKGSCKVKKANEGWQWAQENDLIDNHDRAELRSDLRKMGYVFWDASRLNEEWNLSVTSIEKLNLNPRSTLDDYGDWGLPGSNERFEERFRGLQIPNEALDSAEGGILANLKPSEEWNGVVYNDFPLPFSEQEVKLFNFEY